MTPAGTDEDPMATAADKLKNVENEMWNGQSEAAKPRLELNKAELKADALTKALREEAEQ